MPIPVPLKGRAVRFSRWAGEFSQPCRISWFGFGPAGHSDVLARHAEPLDSEALEAIDPVVALRRLMGEEAPRRHVFTVSPRDGIEGRVSGEGDQVLLGSELVHGLVQLGFHPGELRVRGVRPASGQGPEQNQGQPQTEEKPGR